MDAMLADLESALEVEVARAGRSTGEATTVLDSVPRRQRMVPSRRVSIAGILLVLAATAAALVIAGLSGDDEQRGGDGGSGGGGGSPSASEVELTAARDFDPRGRRRRARRRGQAGDRRDPQHGLADRDLHRRRGHRALGQVGRRSDRRSRRAGRGARASPSARPRAAGAPRSTRAADGPPDDLAGWGEPVGAFEDAARGAADRAQRRGTVAVLPDLVHRARRHRRRAVEVNDVALNGI